jgi:hypothetical protein
LAHKIQTPRNKPKERIQHSEHSKSLKSRPSTYCTGDWVGPRAGLDGSGKSHPSETQNPGPSSPQQITTPTTISCPRLNNMPTTYEHSIGLDALEKRETSVPIKNQNTNFPSCSTYSLFTTLTKLTVHLVKQLPMTWVVSYLKIYLQKFITRE